LEKTGILVERARHDGGQYQIRPEFADSLDTRSLLAEIFAD
jgi:hypothetical protein